jgi:hypothetical protein
MKQYRITTANIPQTSPDDCYLAPDDPAHEYIAAGIMDGLGANARIQAIRNQKTPVFQDDRARIQREMNIKPGTPAWFELWYGGAR